jgi:antirestriction protein
MTHEQPQLTEVASAPAPAESSAVTSAGDAEQPPITSPQIWVGSLVDYNNGQLYGAWIDAAREPAAIQADIQTMLADSPWTAQTGEPAEEWGIFDFDDFGACRLDQHEDLAWVSGVARGIAAHGLAFAAWADIVEEPALLADFDEAYIGHYDSLHAYVEQLINDLGYDQLLDRVVPPGLRPYVKIDLAATAQDLDADLHTVKAAEGGVWIFNAR